MAFSEVSICNMALARVGHTLAIPAGTGLITDASSTEVNLGKAIDQCKLWYEMVRDAVGRDFAYGAVTKYALLTLANDGDGEVWENVWENAWAYPGDCLWMRGFIWPDVGSTQGWQSPDLLDAAMGWGLRAGARWITGQLSGSRVIFANGVDEDNPLVEYTVKQTDAVDNDVDVGNAHAWRLAVELAVPLLGADTGTRMRDWCHKNYLEAVDVAKRAAANEQVPYESGDGSWILSRGA